jgi:hypothetical protein
MSGKMSDRKMIQALYTQIANNRVRTISGQHFLPPSSLPNIFTPYAIAQAVEELQCELDEKIGLAEHISENASIIFAILVWIKEEDSIVAFRNNGVIDANLTLGVDRAEQISPEFGKYFSREVQWEFNPYIFPNDMAIHHVNFQTEKILPFVDEEKEIAVGGFSRVTEVNIHPSMQRFSSEPVCLDPLKRSIPQPHAD